MKDIKHIGIVGPIHLPSLKGIIFNYEDNWPLGMGGVPVNHLIIGLFRLGYKISVYSISPEISTNDVFEYHQENLSIFIGPSRKKARSRCADLFYEERLFIKKSILSTSPTFIHAHWQYEWGWGALSTGIPTLITCHDDPIEVFKVQPDLYRFVRLIMAVIVLRKAKFLTTVSPYCQRGLSYITKKAISIVPNHEPSFVFDLYKPNRQISNGINFVMINNGFTSRKNVEVGIKAFCKFNENEPLSKLHLFGCDFEVYGLAYNWCKSNRINIKNIIFRGALPFEELMQELSSMDILLHTSREESFGMVLVEAMAMGIPVIAGKKSGGPQWILKQGGGCLVDIYDIDDILIGIKRIIYAYSNFSDEARNASLERFSEYKVVSQYLDAYQRMLEAS